MARVMICPSCQYQGSIPDEFQAKRIRCPQCKEAFDVASATRPTGAAAARPAPAKRPPVASTAFDDSDRAAAHPSITNAGGRRTPGPGHNAGTGSGQSPLVYAALGVGGVAVLLLGAVLVVLLTRGGGGPPARVDARATSCEPSVPPSLRLRLPRSNRCHRRLLRQQWSRPPRRNPRIHGPLHRRRIAKSAVNAPTAIDGPEIVRRLKEATVYIKNKIAGKTLASGTGFVIEVRGDAVLLATNRHVAVVDVSEVPPSLVPKGARVELEAVFRSGQGSQKSRRLREIIAADTTDEFSTDLAILLVRGVKNPPKPLSVFAKSDTTEGMAYTGAGFPLGGMLEQGQ